MPQVAHSSPPHYRLPCTDSYPTHSSAPRITTTLPLRILSRLPAPSPRTGSSETTPPLPTSCHVLPAVLPAVTRHPPSVIRHPSPTCPVLTTPTGNDVGYHPPTTPPCLPSSPSSQQEDANQRTQQAGSPPSPRFEFAMRLTPPIMNVYTPQSSRCPPQPLPPQAPGPFGSPDAPHIPRLLSQTRPA